MTYAELIPLFPTADAAKNPEVRWDIIDEHLEEAEFLFGQWEASLRSPTDNLDEICRGTERRLLEHVDGLVTGGEPVADATLVPRIEEESDSRSVAAASLALLLGGVPTRFDWLIGRLLDMGDEASDAAARALGICEHPQLTPRLISAYRQADDSRQQIPLLRALVQRRVALGVDLERALWSAQPQLVEVALHAAAFAGRGPNLALVERFLGSPDDAVRKAAIRTGLILGSPNAWDACLRSAGSADDDASLESICMVGLVGDPRQHEWIADLIARGHRGAEAVWAAGHTGRIACARACLDVLDDQRLGPLAAEAFAAIVGLDVDSGEFTEIADDDDAAADLDDDGLAPGDLGVPNAAAIRSWWEHHESRFDPAVRYLRGEPYDHGSLLRALHRAPMRRRPLLALELSIRTRGGATLATSALGATQRRQLARVVALPRVDCQRPYLRIH